MKPILAIALLLTWLAPLSRVARADEVPSLSVDEVARKLGDKAVFLYDNNPRKGYDQGHLPGAHWVDYKHVTAADLPADKSATLIFYCANWM
jgi:3-mercaptopyruvate sulfurtransferase SseA